MTNEGSQGLWIGKGVGKLAEGRMGESASDEWRRCWLGYSAICQSKFLSIMQDYRVAELREKVMTSGEERC